MKAPPGPGPGPVRPRVGPAARAGASGAGGRAGAGHAGRCGRDHAAGASDSAAGGGDAGVDRRPAPAGVRGHGGVRAARSGRRARPLPRLQVQARAGRGRAVRGELGPRHTAARPAHGGPPCGPAWAARGARRPLGGSVDGGRVRGVGLRRTGWLARPRRPGADRRRAARELRRGRRAPGAKGAGRDSLGTGVHRPREHRHPGDRGHLRPDRGLVGVRAPGRAERASGLRAATAGRSGRRCA
jgi:hypothetical protein